MRKLFFLFMIGLLWQTGMVCAQGYHIKVNVPKMANQKLILANYFEGKVYSVDTAFLDASGNGAFHKTDKKTGQRYVPAPFFSQQLF